MPAINYIPAKDLDFKAWALNFSTLITATPTAFGLTAPQAVAYAALYSAFNLALTAATDPATRTSVTVAAKDTARVSLEISSRDLAGIVQSFPTITSGQLTSLGLTVRSTVRPPVPPPATMPILAIVANSPLAAILRFSDELTPDSRKKPFGATSMEVFVKYGATPPASVADATFLGDATRNPHPLAFNPAQAGETAWLVARWKNRKGETGPTSGAISTTVIAP